MVHRNSSLLNSQYADAGNVNAGETDLLSFSIPGGTLAANGDAIEFEAWGKLANNGNTKVVQAKFGGTTFNGFSTSVADGDWHITGRIVRSGATTQRAFSFMAANVVGSNTAISITSTVTPAETLSGAVTLKVTGQGAASNDIIQKGMIIRLAKAA